MGLLWSSHPDNKTQRYYDADALERLKQIIVLRKLQIPVKDIITIFKSEDTTALIQAFVDKLESLDTEISALSELRQIVDDFLHKMLLSGIKKISAITLLYEETEKRLATSEPMVSHEKNGSVMFERLSEVSREALRLHDVRVIQLPFMRVLTSRLKTGQAEGLDENLFEKYGFMPNPGLRNCFFRKEPNGEWIMLIKIPQDYENATGYIDEDFPGGLYAIATSFMTDMDDTFILLRDYINRSDDYAFDTGADGLLQRDEMIEEILPWDIVEKFNRYQQDVFVPIRIKNEKDKEQLTMEDIKFLCQSCASPLSNPEDYGTESDGSKSGDYCSACYENSSLYGGEDMKMEEMIELCVPYTVQAGKYKNEDEARTAMREFFPKLKRWAK
jgi:DNA-binding transcriptional MerR regulator